MAKWKSGARGGRPDQGGGGFRGGRGRGHNDRGRGGPGRGRGHSHSGSNSSMQDELDVDFTLQTYANAPSPLKPFPAEASASRGRGNPAFRGRGRGVLIPMQLRTNTTFSSRGRGFDIPRRYVQGIGAHKDARRPVQVGTLSNLLNQERPLLKPIVFVPSTETRFLFQDEEELMQPIVEDVDNAVQSPIPTADRVTRVFSGGSVPPNIWDNDGDGTEDGIEVVDFNDVGKLFHATASTSIAAIPKRRSKLESTAVHEDPNTRNRIQETRRIPAEIENIPERVDKTLSVPNGIDNHLFYVDSQPTNPTFQQPPSVVLSDDDDVIVYVAPHPRNTLRTSVREKESTEGVIERLTTNGHGVDIPGFSSYERHGALPTSISHTHLESTRVEEPLLSASPTTFTTSHISPTSSSITTGNPTFTPDRVETTNGATATGTPTRLRIPPITTPRQAKLWKSKITRASKGTKALRNAPFSAFGTMREEDLLRRLDDGEQDKKYDQRRRGDSDLEWGDTTDDDGEGVVSVGKEAGDMNPQEQGPELDADMKRVLGMLEKGKAKAGENSKRVNHDIGNDHGMEIDVDIDIETLERFASGLTGADAEKYFTTDDIDCEEIIKMEDEGDEDEKQRSSSGSEDDEDEGTVDEEEEEALRIEEAKFMSDGDLGNLDGSDQEMDDLGDDDDDLDDEDEDEDDSSFLSKLNRLRSTGAVLGGVEDSDDLSLRAMTLADQDEAFIRNLDLMLNEKKDTKGRQQQKKLSDDDFEYLNWSSSPAGWRTDLPPELSIQYELDRQKKAKWKEQRDQNRLARAADPLSKKKGGKKGRKAMLAASTVDPTIMILPNRVIDMTTLVQNIRRFIADVGGPSSMSLPPTDKETRKNVHDLAVAFNLKSVSKGKGDARYTTLTKTTRSGIQVNEGKIARIVRRSAARGGSFVLEDKKGKGVSRVPKHREGDVVGKAAPKLDESNVGFKLLEQMGWSEGKRIGASTNGLVAPLAAIIKTSKLGLGARK